MPSSLSLPDRQRQPPYRAGLAPPLWPVHCCRAVFSYFGDFPETYPYFSSEPSRRWAQVPGLGPVVGQAQGPDQARALGRPPGG